VFPQHNVILIKLVDTDVMKQLRNIAFHK